MLNAQKEKLLSYDKQKWVSLGITKAGVPMYHFSIPWKLHANIMNCKVPEVFIDPEDLADVEIMKMLHEFQIKSLYIYSPLSDYSFIGDSFQELRELNIYSADKMENVDFLRKLRHLRLVFVQNSVFDCTIVRIMRKTQKRFCECIALDRCTTIGLPALRGLSFSEMLIWDQSSNKMFWDDVTENVCIYRFVEVDK